MKRPEVRKEQCQALLLAWKDPWRLDVPVLLPAPAWLCPPAPRQLPSLAPFFTLTTKLPQDSALFLHHPFDRILLAGDKTLSMLTLQ